MRIFLLDRTNLNESYQHSVLISALRSIAALQVVAAHLRGELFPSLKTVADPSLWYQGLAFFTGFSHIAVVIFFLLSGWLVGGSLLNKLGEPNCMMSYAIDRLTRMWIVLVPAFVLTLAIGTITQTVDPGRISYAPDNEYSWSTFWGNLFGLQGMAVPRFGGNFSLWSLSNEMWYYALFPLLLLPVIGQRGISKVAGLAACAVIGYLLLFDLMLYFVIWLLGVLFSRIRIELGRAARFLLIVVILGLAVHFRLSGSIGTLVAATFAEDLLFSVLFLCLLSSLQFPADRARIGNRLAKLAGLLAPFSFTLYVIHYPLIYLAEFLHDPIGTQTLSTSDPASLLVYRALFVAIVVFAYLFHLPFEAHTYRLRRFVKRMVLAPAVEPSYSQR
ncbi:acyltransferase [Massilia sp. LC238]|uniref:acyltransferase family protein n=1 Tax=Massilia sp. LC238 TaxID=1502852 RepID=UPI00056535D5|nr:acyltransferase [Massilia sp. LC238]